MSTEPRSKTKKRKNIFHRRPRKFKKSHAKDSIDSLESLTRDILDLLKHKKLKVFEMIEKNDPKKNNSLLKQIQYYNLKIYEQTQHYVSQTEALYDWYYHRETRPSVENSSSDKAGSELIFSNSQTSSYEYHSSSSSFPSDSSTSPDSSKSASSPRS